MNILAFDTSHIACSVALLHGNAVHAFHEIAPKQQTKLILPMISKALASAAISLKELDAIAYGGGPGSFTGIRIASSVAQGLGFASEKPVIRVSSLAAMAEAVFLERQWRKLLVAVDAHMGQVYWARYQVNSEGLVVLEGEETLSAPDEVSLPPGEDWYAIGDGFEKYPEKLRTRLGFKPLAIHTEALATGVSVLTLARVSYAKKEWLRPEDAIPVYLR